MVYMKSPADKLSEMFETRPCNVGEPDGISWKRVYRKPCKFWTTKQIKAWFNSTWDMDGCQNYFYVIVDEGFVIWNLVRDLKKINKDIGFIYSS